MDAREAHGELSGMDEMAHSRTGKDCDTNLWASHSRAMKNYDIKFPL